MQERAGRGCSSAAAGRRAVRPPTGPGCSRCAPYVRETERGARCGPSSASRRGRRRSICFPSCGSVLADLAPAPALESEGARFRLFESVTAFLNACGRAAARAGARRPAGGGRAFAAAVAVPRSRAGREPPADRRRVPRRRPDSGGPTHDDSHRTAREPVTRTLALAGLAAADVARFIELAAPGASAGDLGAVVHAETEGNPLFVGEVVRLLAAEGRLDEPASTPLAIPQSVREVIGRRLRHLSDDCNRLLGFASVLGHEFDLDALAGVSGLERGELLELLDEAIEARVVSEVPAAIGRMCFAHALIRDATYHHLTRSRRIQLHRQAGEVLEALYSSDLDPQSLSLHITSSSPQRVETDRRRSTTRSGPERRPSPCSPTRRQCAYTGWRSRRSRKADQRRANSLRAPALTG